MYDYPIHVVGNLLSRSILLFPDAKSPLARLSDAIKVGLRTCSDAAASVLLLHQENREALETLRSLASNGAGEDALRPVAEKIPRELALRGVRLHAELHSHALAVLLNCCFCLEAYANTFAHYLFGKADYLGLIRRGHGDSTTALTKS